jgi:hypothetical protein
MSDLGAVGKNAWLEERVRLLTSAPVCRVVMLGDRPEWTAGRSARDTLPVHIAVDSPIPVAGLKSLECYAPGSFVFLRPVDAGTMVQISVKVRKNADYVTSMRTQAQRTPRDLLPFLEIERADGVRVRDTMADVTETWDTLQAELEMFEAGALFIRLVQEGTLGDNMLFVPSTRRATVPGPKCWWADLVATVN